MNELNIDKKFEIIEWHCILNCGIQVEIRYPDGSSDSGFVDEATFERMQEIEEPIS